MQVHATVHPMAEVWILVLVIVRSMAVVLERKCAHLVSKG
jgi:hypothetical protein